MPDDHGDLEVKGDLELEVKTTMPGPGPVKVTMPPVREGVQLANIALSDNTGRSFILRDPKGIYITAMGSEVPEGEKCTALLVYGKTPVMLDRIGALMDSGVPLNLTLEPRFKPEDTLIPLAEPLDKGPCELCKIFDLVPVDDFVFLSDTNSITFKLQEGPISKRGKNGCQIDDVILAAKTVLLYFNEKFPCPENEKAIQNLSAAVEWLERRTMDREQRGVEGRDKV